MISRRGAAKIRSVASYEDDGRTECGGVASDLADAVPANDARGRYGFTATTFPFSHT